jgi:GTP cyclohydrolase I
MTPPRTLSDAALKDIAQAVERILAGVGEDPRRNELLRTPQRVAKSMAYLTSGYTKDVHDVLNGAVFASDSDEMVIVKDIEI